MIIGSRVVPGNSSAKAPCNCQRTEFSVIGKKQHWYLCKLTSPTSYNLANNDIVLQEKWFPGGNIVIGSR